jgi:uncharacterized protein (DUF1499 family)
MNENTMLSTKGGKACSWAGKLAITGLVAALAGLVAGQLGVSPFIAMILVAIGSLLGIIGAVFGSVGLLRSGGTGGGSSAPLAWLALVLGVAVIVNTAGRMGGGGAAIHDVSTDTDNPPAFNAVAALRGPEDNPAEYSGGDTAAQQQTAYPDLETIVLLDPYTFVFNTALDVAKEMGWEIVASDVASGIIEATDTTPFVGFKDDVVIRVRAKSAETLVDVRSKSRLGRGDMGVNANRIRAYTKKLVETANP